MKRFALACLHLLLTLVLVALPPARGQNVPTKSVCVQCTLLTTTGNCNCTLGSVSYTMSCSPTTCQSTNGNTICGETNVVICTTTAGTITFPTCPDSNVPLCYKFHINACCPTPTTASCATNPVTAPCNLHPNPVSGCDGTVGCTSWSYGGGCSPIEVNHQLSWCLQVYCEVCTSTAPCVCPGSSGALGWTWVLVFDCQACG